MSRRSSQGRCMNEVGLLSGLGEFSTVNSASDCSSDILAVSILS